jgi:hypothetical protein
MERLLFGLHLNSRAIFLALGILTSFAPTSYAELIDTYAPIFVDEADASTFFIGGEIDARSALNFDRAISAFGEPKTLVLMSEGGLVNESLIIAGRVRRLGIATYVPDGKGCYSACSFIFLAGEPRFADGELGVHQISSSENDLALGQIAISDILDVLSDFDTPDELLVDMFRTPSDQMHILSVDEKIKYGFLKSTGSTQTLRPGQNLFDRAKLAMLDYNRKWSQQNTDALPDLQSLLADKISFYGKEVSRKNVMSEKTTFAERWPVRSYTVNADTIRISCEESVCSVTAVIQWDVADKDQTRRSRGLAEFILGVKFDDVGYSIISEGGHVIKRY